MYEAVTDISLTENVTLTRAAHKETTLAPFATQLAQLENILTKSFAEQSHNYAVVSQPLIQLCSPIFFPPTQVVEEAARNFKARSGKQEAQDVWKEEGNIFDAAMWELLAKHEQSVVDYLAHQRRLSVRVRRDACIFLTTDDKLSASRQKKSWTVIKGGVYFVWMKVMSTDTPTAVASTVVKQ